MFYCEVLGTLSKPGEGSHKVIVRVRPKTYSKMVKNEETRKWVKVEAGRGYEIVKELTCSEEGVRLWNERHPEGPEMEGQGQS